ncbi:MAG: peptide-methionine (R)-S-oxide reductase MsrB [Sphingomonadaceae bacterium]
MEIDRRAFIALGGAGLVGAALAARSGPGEAAAGEKFEISLGEAQWKRRLTAAEFRVLRKGGTERAGSSPLDREKRRGTYVCAGCKLPLFSSQAKYDSGTGWPSFRAPLDNAVGTRPDDSLFMKRTEVHCRRCGGHLGHVFDDGPPPTGKRYCMNGVALDFVPA